MSHAVTIDATAHVNEAWRRSARAATVAAVALAIAYAASPLTVLFGGATLAMCWWVVADLEGSERAWVTRILAITIGLRFVFVGALLVATRPDHEPFLSLFPDGAYLIARSLWIRNVWLGVPIGPHQALQIVEPYGASSYPLLLAAIQYLVGPAPYGLALLSTAAYVAGVLLWYRIVRARFGSSVATSGLTLLLVWPSLFMWSAAVLKESFQFFLTAVVTSAAYHVVRSERWIARSAWVAALAIGVSLLSTLRSGAAEIAMTAVAVAILFRAMTARRWMAVAVALLLVVAVAGQHDRFLSAVRMAANRHAGYWGSPGQSYQLLDITFYSSPAIVETMTFAESVQFLGSAMVAFVAVPTPWTAGSTSELALAPQQIAWYLAVVAALVGVRVGLRRDPWLTCVLAGIAMAGLIIIGPNSGNVGTLVRHRDLIVPFVLWLSVIGAIPSLRALLDSRGASAA